MRVWLPNLWTKVEEHNSETSTTCYTVSGLATQCSFGGLQDPLPHAVVDEDAGFRATAIPDAYTPIQILRLRIHIAAHP